MTDEWNSSVATELDLVIHQLEILTLEEGQKQSTEYWTRLANSIKDERDAALADLARIKMIVSNPLQILNGQPVEYRPSQADRDGEQPSEAPSVT